MGRWVRVYRELYLESCMGGYCDGLIWVEGSGEGDWGLKLCVREGGLVD